MRIGTRRVFKFKPQPPNRCLQSDFPTSVSGKIALISRGDCSFGQKVVKASLSGVKAVVIYDNSPGGPIAGTLGPPQAEAPFVPALSIPQATGLDIIKKLESGEDVMLHLVVKGSTTEQRSTHNVIAETLEGDKQNVLHVGAHSDSVSAGPGTAFIILH
jgi:carboxypeptidase Q